MWAGSLRHLPDLQRICLANAICMPQSIRSDGGDMKTPWLASRSSLSGDGTSARRMISTSWLSYEYHNARRN